MLACAMCCESTEFDQEDKRGYPRDEVDRRRRVSPAAERNKAAVQMVIEKHLTSRSRILEVASGTGQHVAYLGAMNSRMVFQPTEFKGFASHRFEEHDVDDCLKSINAYCEDLDNVLPAVALDVAAMEWPVEKDKKFDAVIAVDLFHVSSPAVKAGLFAGADRVLKKSRGIVFVYGKFSKDGDLLSPENAILDQDLRRSGHSGWGLIDTKEVDAIAKKYDFDPIAIEKAPDSSLCLVYAKCAK